ncbi:hypothetical protein F2Q70_00016280 [Brassica cretica]|uniref:Uncharacterized protein n=1 Tax=Brassica cretica TaxID=69181 RepID=A0A8S9I1T0_BRACR|nr:hypothetical protein F2Q70_00016280 [Brassica cretica]KAF2595781.1 hypothetical protein F2Q68_00009260 [Brassica cretica]
MIMSFDLLIGVLIYYPMVLISTLDHTIRLERIASCPCWYRERELKLRSSDHEWKQDVVASGIESSIASWLRSCLGIELRRSEVASWDRVTNGNKMRIRFRVRDREFSTVRVYRRGDYGFVD